MPNNAPRRIDTDVLIAGSGPVGCTFARRLVEAGRTVLMVEAGAQHSARPGEHLKNAFVYQRDLDKFTPIVEGLLHPLSTAQAGAGSRTTIDPISFRPEGKLMRSAYNPHQDPEKNMEAAAASYGVGGMFTHWTSNTPRHHPTIERTPFIDADEWDELYTAAEQLLDTHTDVYSQSLRHTAVKEALADHYQGQLPSGYEPTDLPVAGHRLKNDEFVHFTGADTILGPLIDEPQRFAPNQFVLKAQHRLTSLDVTNGSVQHAVVEDLLGWQSLHIKAEQYVVAAGAVLTPQILFKSGIGPPAFVPALGRYLTEHPMTFTQIVMSETLVRRIKEMAKERSTQLEPGDPVPIPMHDPPPMAWIPVSEGRPWHCQVHRDSFHYGGLPADIDDRLVVDLRWFGMVEPRPDNRVSFADDVNDKFGMPHPTFHYTLGADDKRRARMMMSDMVEAAQALGGFLAGAEPRFLPPGASLHLQGTIRMGVDEQESVVDPFSRVWGIDNLYLGGNGLIPTANASNPTLTSVALAIRATNRLSPIAGT